MIVWALLVLFTHCSCIYERINDDGDVVDNDYDDELHVKKPRSPAQQ